MDNNASFGQLFDLYRLRAGLRTMGDFASALAEEGLVYEDSIFSKWKNGSRVPRDRETLLAIIKVVFKKKGISNIEEANALLESAGLRSLTSNEVPIVGFGFANSHLSSDRFSSYLPLVEPPAAYQTIPLNSNTTRVVNLVEIENLQIRKFWEHQTFCAVADYYSRLSLGMKTPEEAFNNLQYDYSRETQPTCFVCITTDSETGREYLSGTARFEYGERKRSSAPLMVMSYFGVDELWPHTQLGINYSQIGEMGRFVIPNWVGTNTPAVISLTIHKVLDFAHELGLQIVYAHMFSHWVKGLQKRDFPLVVVPGIFPLYSVPNAAVLYPKAYISSQEYPAWWRAKPSVYYSQIRYD